MKIEDRGVICDTSRRPEAERIAAFTSLCTTAAGTVLASAQIGAAKHARNSTILLCRSRDQGRTWQELGFRFDSRFLGVTGHLCSGEMAEVEPGRLLLATTWFDRSDPNRPLFDPVTQGILPGRQLVAESTDEGETWSPWREIGVGGLKGCGYTGPMLRWPDGTLGFAFESYKEFDDPAPGIHGAWLLLSRDGGRTFGLPQRVAEDPAHRIFYWDQRLCVGRRPGEFYALFWTHDLERKEDLNVHFLRGRREGNKLDCGPISATEIPGQIAAPLALADGRLLAFVVNRGRPGTMTLWASRDGGASWPEKLVVYVHEEQARLSQGDKNIDFSQYWADMVKWSFGHPAIRLLADGRVLLAHYAGTPGCLSLHWIRVTL